MRKIQNLQLLVHFLSWHLYQPLLRQDKLLLLLFYLSLSYPAFHVLNINILLLDIQSIIYMFIYMSFIIIVHQLIDDFDIVFLRQVLISKFAIEQLHRWSDGLEFGC